MLSSSHLSQTESAKFLYTHLGKTQKYWYRRLTKNLYRPSLLHGYRITVHVVDGKPMYTLPALHEFVLVNQHSKERKMQNVNSANQQLNTDKAKARSLMLNTIKNMISKGNSYFNTHREHRIENAITYFNEHLMFNGLDCTEEELEQAFLERVKLMEEFNAIYLS